MGQYNSEETFSLICFVIKLESPYGLIFSRIDIKLELFLIDFIINSV